MLKNGKCCGGKLGVILAIIGAVVVIAGIAAIVFKVLNDRKIEDEWDLDDDDCCFYADTEDFGDDDDE
jgi:hypothetical protein